MVFGNLKNKMMRIFDSKTYWGMNELLRFFLMVLMMIRMNNQLFYFVPSSLLYKVLVILSVPFVLLNTYANYPGSRSLVITGGMVLISSVLSVLINYSYATRLSITFLIDIYVFIGVFVIGRFRKTSARMEYLMQILYLGVTLVFSLISLYVFISKATIVFSNGYEVFQPGSGDEMMMLSGIYTHHNLAGISILVSIIFAVRLLISSRKNHVRIVLGIYSAFQMVCLLLSGSRSVFLVGIVLLGVIFVKWGRINRKVFFTAVLLVILFCIGYGVFNGKMDFRRSNDTFQVIKEFITDPGSLGSLLDRITTGRSVLWKEAVMVTSSHGIRHILFGYGVGSIANVGEQYMQGTYMYYMGFNNTHNLLVDTYLYNGLVGVAALLLLFINVAKTVMRKKQYQHSEIAISLLMVALAVGTFSMIDCAVMFINKIYCLQFWNSIGILSVIDEIE